MMRYRTHDLTTLDTGRCECGRTLARMEKVRARTDDMLIVRGVNVFPSQIEDVLFQIEGVRPHYLVVVDRKRNLDDIEVRIEVEEAVFSDIMADMVAFQRSVSDKLQSVLGLRARVVLVEPGAIERSAGRASASWTCGKCSHHLSSGRKETACPTGRGSSVQAPCCCSPLRSPLRCSSAGVATRVAR